MNQPNRCKTETGIWRNSQKNEAPSRNTAGHITVIEIGDELRRQQKEFETEFEIYQKMNPTFTQIAKTLMESKGWNSFKFKKHTRLDNSMYSRIINGEDDRNWSLRTIVAFCFGIGASDYYITQMMTAAGRAFGASMEDRVYAYALNKYRGKSIDECNAFLEYMHVRKLGSQDE